MVTQQLGLIFKEKVFKHLEEVEVAVKCFTSLTAWLDVLLHLTVSLLTRISHNLKLRPILFI